MQKSASEVTTLRHYRNRTIIIIIIIILLTLVLRFYFYAHVLRLGVKKAPRSLSTRTTNVFVSNLPGDFGLRRVQRK